METNAQYFDSLCRTCMNKVEASSHDATTKPQQQWLLIFEPIEECGQFRIAELLSDAVPQIEVQPTDELPNKICTECLQRLLSVYRFQQMCLQSDKEMHELLSKEQIVLQTPMLEEATRCETETNDADSEPLIYLPCSSTLQNLQQSSIQEALAEVIVPTIEPEATQSSADDDLQEITQLVEHCNDSQGDFGEFIKNEPIEDDEANSEYSDCDTIQSTISVTKEEPIELEDQLENVISSQYNRHLNEHKKIANNRKEYCFACHLCNESYKDQRNLSRHLNLAHSIEPKLTCDVCNKSFASPARLRKHIRMHTGERPYVCPECGKSFSTQGILANHRKIHVEDKAYECTYCPLRFTTNATKWSHEKMHEEAKGATVLSHKNEDPQTRERNIEALMEGEAELKQLISKDKTQQTSAEILQELKDRIRRNDSKPYECPYCPLRFHIKCNMIQHKKSHEGVGRKPCDICGKKMRKQDLKIHKQLVHRKEKLHKCHFCEKRFGYINALRQHTNQHTGEKPFKCKYCESAYSTRPALNRHLRVHLGDNIYRCEFCPLTFPSVLQRSLHFVTHKNEDPETRERNIKALHEDEAKLRLGISKEKTQQLSTEESEQQLKVHKIFRVKI